MYLVVPKFQDSKQHPPDAQRCHKNQQQQIQTNPIVLINLARALRYLKSHQTLLDAVISRSAMLVTRITFVLMSKEMHGYDKLKCVS